MSAWFLDSELSTCFLQSSTMAKKYRLKRTGAMVHPCQTPFLTVKLSELCPLTRTVALISTWKEWITDSNTSSTLNFFNTCHKASRGSESYAFLRSTKRTKRRLLCSLIFPTNWQATKIMSIQLWPCQNLHWESGSTDLVIHCKHSCVIYPSSFPATSSKLMPLQLSHVVRSPF